jgi:hypothetical protein
MKILITIFIIIFIGACSYIPFGKKEKPIIHSGHFLNSKNTKEKNEEILRTMENKNYSLVNLTLEDLLISKSQNINFESFPRLIFINSSIVDLEKDNLFQGSNIVSFYVLNDTCFIGLSDNTSDMPSEHFLLNDYVLSILKAKHEAQKQNPTKYVIIHKLGSDFEKVADRLPADFRALLTN